MSESRIKAIYKSGTGDLGISLIMDGSRLSKDDPACWIYSEVEHLNNAISEFLVTFELQYSELLEILNWLKVNSFSISSFCFLKGNSDRHTLNPQFAGRIHAIVDTLKADSVIGEAADFVHHTHKKYIRLDRIRIHVRDLERAFTKWRNHDLVRDCIVNAVRHEPLNAQAIVLAIDCYAGFLNRLSTFIWLATRKEAEICGDFDSQLYWNGGLESVVS